MVCFCTNTMHQLRMVLPTLNAATGASASVATRVDAQVSLAIDASLGPHAPVRALAAWLAQAGLPAAPWSPDLAWLSMTLPRPTLDAGAVATLQAFAQLQVMAQALGMDLTTAAQATAFTRLAATLDARLSVLIAETGGPIDPGPWLQLAAAASASTQVTAALRLGVLPVLPQTGPPPMGPPLAPWRPFLSQLRALLPLVAVAGQLRLDLSAGLSAQLAPTLRAMLRIPMPAMTASLSLMASLSAALAAIAQLKVDLGIAPLKLGLPAVRLLVAEKMQAAATLVEQNTGRPLSALITTLPRIDYCPSLMATADVVSAAMSLQLPPATWQVPPMANLPVLCVGLPVAAFCTQLKAAMALEASLSPCGAGCDAKALHDAVSA